MVFVLAVQLPWQLLTSTTAYKCAHLRTLQLLKSRVEGND